MMFLRMFVQAMQRDDISQRAMTFAYHAIFIMPPFFVLILSILGLFLRDIMTPDVFVEQLSLVAGEETALALLPHFTAFASTGLSVTSLVTALLILLIVGSQMHTHLRRSFDAMWRITDTGTPSAREALRERSAGFVLTFAVGFFFAALLAASTLLFTFGPLLGDLFGLPHGLLLAGNFISVFLVVLLMFLMLYTMVPDVDIRARDAFPGALMATTLLILGNYLLGLYVRMVPKISLYGVVAGFLVILVWSYLLGLLIFVGMDATRAYMRHAGRHVTPRGSYQFTSLAERARNVFRKP